MFISVEFLRRQSLCRFCQFVDLWQMRQLLQLRLTIRIVSFFFNPSSPRLARLASSSNSDSLQHAHGAKKRRSVSASMQWV